MSPRDPGSGRRPLMPDAKEQDAVRRLVQQRLPQPRPPAKQDKNAVPIDTYFGFFAQSVFTALAASISAQVGRQVLPDGVALTTTNTLKLRWSSVDSVAVPGLAVSGQLPFVLAFTAQDIAALTGLSQGRTSLQRMMEQAVSTAVEPFNFISKSRNRLNGLEFSRNVTGLTAHHLAGEVVYTMAEGRMQIHRGESFSVRLLVTAEGRDLIEDRTEDKATQRALFAVNEGAYVCRPQWDPPSPPPEFAENDDLSETHLNGWLQAFFALNDGTVPNRVFRQPAAMLSQVLDGEALGELAAAGPQFTVIRMVLNDQKAQELFVLLSPETRQTLLSLSKSGGVKFLGDFFRVLFGEAGPLWEQFSGQELRWRILAVRPMPSDAVDLIEERVAGGGIVARQSVRLEEGTVSWLVALTPHTWHALLRLTAQGMQRPVNSVPNRYTIFGGTGWQRGTAPWNTLVSFCSERDLQNLVRRLSQARLSESHFAAVAATLRTEQRERWMEAMPVMQRERTESYRLAAGEIPALEHALTQALIASNRAGRLPEGKLGAWVGLFSEMLWGRRQALIDRLLPLRHLIYGLDRSSLSRLLFDVRNQTLEELLSWAEFPVIDQVRRAITPGFALRLLEDIAVRRRRATAFACQEAQLTLYRQCLQGLAEGRYLVRATPARNLRDLMRWIDEPHG